jgi:hypothetical protein
MALTKTPVSLNFAQGLDLKTDPNQVSIGKFLSYNNIVFDTPGQLKKRNGYPYLTELPNTNETTLTTLNDNLIATGSNLYAYDQSSNDWLSQGTIQPVQLSTLPLVRTSTSQSSPDIAVSQSGLSCLVYVDNSVAYYHIINAETGYQVVPRTAIASGAVAPRVFTLGVYFIITYLTSINLRYIAIPITMPGSPSVSALISSSVAGTSAGYDAMVFSDALYIAWAGGSTNFLATQISAGLTVSAPVTVSASVAPTLVSWAADAPNNILYVSSFKTNTIYVAAYTDALVPVLANTSAAQPRSMN